MVSKMLCNLMISIFGFLFANADNQFDPYVFNKKINNGHTEIVVAVGNNDRGNMLDLKADVVVDAANTKLEPGGGVSGALYEAAGCPDVDKVWRKNFASSGIRVPTGSARFNTNDDVIVYSRNKSNVMRIVHAVAPQCNNTESESLKKDLFNAYKNALKEMEIWLSKAGCISAWNQLRAKASVLPRKEGHLMSIVFPLLGTGIYRCNPRDVAAAAAKAIEEYFSEHKDSKIGRVIIAPFDPEKEKIVLSEFSQVFK